MCDFTVVNRSPVMMLGPLPAFSYDHKVQTPLSQDQILIMKYGPGSSEIKGNWLGPLYLDLN